MIELLKFNSHPGAENAKKLFDIGPTHFAVTVDNLDETVSKLKKEEIGFLSEPKVSPDAYAKVVFCKAPEGTFVELVEVL